MQELDESLSSALRGGWLAWVHRWVPVGVFTALVLACSAWLWPGAGWVFDLAAGLAPQLAGVAGVVGLILLLRRRGVGGGVAFGCAVVGLLGIVLQPRADMAVGGGPSGGLSGGAGSVRVLLVNVAASNRRSAEVLGIIRDARADVVVLLETPSELLGFLREDGSLRVGLPYGWLPERASTGYTAVLTRWPQFGGERLTGPVSATLADGLRVMRLDRPGGAFTLLVLHPDSPRSLSRWRAGNAEVERAIGMVHERLRPTGLPMVIAGDLNSSPSGFRSRRLCSGAGVRRTKPLMKLSGTWPAWSVWPFRLAIDDVLVEPGTGVISWETVSVPGSDHTGVVVELALPEP